MKLVLKDLTDQALFRREMEMLETARQRWAAMSWTRRVWLTLTLQDQAPVGFDNWKRRKRS